MAQFSWKRALASVGVIAATGCMSLQQTSERSILPDIQQGEVRTGGPGGEPANETNRRTPTVVNGQGQRVTQPIVAEQAGGGFTVNLSDADLVEATRVILGDLLNESYTIDPGVQGRVTMSGTVTLSREDLLSLFELALRQNGAALIRQGEAYRVTTLTDAQGAGRLLGPAEPGYGVTAVPLNFIGAETARTLLEGTLLRAGSVRSDPGRNLLLITGTRGERAAAMETLAAFDVDWVAAMSVGVFPVENADPQTLIAELETVFQSAQGGVSAGALKLRPLNRLNSILAIGASPELLTRVGNWIERLDVEAGNTTVLRTYFLDSGKAEETARLLSELLVGGSSSSPSVTSPGDPSVSGTTLSPNSAPRSFSAAPSPPGSMRIIADKLNNAVLVIADPSGHKLVQRALLDIDRQPAQVLVDATIVEVTLSDRLRYGVQWFFETNGIDGVADSGRGGLSRGTGLDADGVFPGFNFILESGTAARVAIDALASVTNVTVRSSPSLMVADNQSATLSVGDEVPVITRQATNVTDTNAPLVNQVEYRKTGVTLSVTPRVSSTSMVTLEIDQEVSSVSESAATGALTPTISQRRIQSTVAVRSGQTLVLGGLIDEAQGKSRSGVPLLSQLPFIGGLFSSSDKNGRRTELVIFLTPRVLRNESDIGRATTELRDRMTSITREDDRRRQARPLLSPP